MTFAITATVMEVLAPSRTLLSTLLPLQSVPRGYLQD